MTETTNHLISQHAQHVYVKIFTISVTQKSKFPVMVWKHDTVGINLVTQRSSRMILQEEEGTTKQMLIAQEKCRFHIILTGKAQV